jgi:hypothetical protein
MQSQGNQNVPVVEAKQEYTRNLKNVIKDTILCNFNTNLEESKKEGDKNDTLVMFQRRLKNVPHWSSAYVDNEVEKIKKNCPWFLELLTAVIITNVKILTSVKVSKTKKKIQIKTPQSDKFVHQIYIEFARAMFEHIKKQKELPNDMTIDYLFDQSLENVIRGHLPIQNILQMYVSENESDEESEDESDAEPEDEPEDEPEEPEESEEPEEDFKDDEPELEENFDGPPASNPCQEPVPMMNEMPTNPAVTPLQQSSLPPPSGPTFFDPPEPEPEIRHVELSGNKPPQPTPADERKREMFFADAAPDPA